MHTDQSPQPERASRHAREALLVVAGFTAVFGWMYLRPVLDHSLLAESDLYEYYLPIFLAPITTWSRFEFGGLPAFADPGDFTAYPPHFFFARVIGSWTALSVSAFVLAASFTYAYVRHITGSRRGAAVAGLAYGLSEALMERLPHAGTLHAAAWLPLILLSIDHLRGDSHRRWLVIGAVAAACCFLAGHPQPAIYIYYCSGLYALAGGLLGRARFLYYARVAALFTLGGLLTFIKALPFVEASFYMARQEVNFGQFVGHANSPAQMLSILFPSVLHEGREAPTYVGLVTLPLALAGALHAWKRDWRVLFWVAIAIFALLMGMGDATPVASLAFSIPLYSKFRVGARHLILAAFALCVLAGMAVAAIERGQMSRRLLAFAAAALACAVIAGAAVLRAVPGAFAFEPRQPIPWTLPVWDGPIWVQLALAAASVGLIALSIRAGRALWWTAALMALLVADTLYSLPYLVSSAGLQSIGIPASAARPSVLATRLAAEVAPLHQRLLAPGGTHRDPVVPAAWARVWQIPIAGGYGPMLLQNHSDLAQMGTNGSVAPSSTASYNLSLDLMAVGRIFHQAEELAVPETFDRAGLRWSLPALEITAGRADCDHPYPRELSLPLPRNMMIVEVAMVSHLRCAEDVAQGTEVVRVSLTNAGAPVFDAPLHAGKEIADRALAEPAVAARAAHTAVETFDDPDEKPNEYLVRLRPPAPVQADRLVLRVPPMHGWLALDRLTLVDAAGASHPQSTIDLFLGDSERWTPQPRFTTSRVSDRDRDEEIGGENPVLVFENRRALPRAWVVREVVPLDNSDLLAAIRYGQLPGGRRFDPRATALVEGPASQARTYPDAARSAVVTSEADGRFEVDVTSAGGVLVLSEAFYPGWRARVDGQVTGVERVDADLQGVVIPAGRHHVTFEFVSTTLRVGTAVSGGALLVCAWLLAGRRRRPTPVPAATA